MPLYTFCLAAASGGIQTALSRFIAETEAKKDPEETRCFLRIALFLTFFISLLLAFCLWCFSDVIAVRFLLETRCQWLLQLLRTLASLLCRARLPYRLFSRKKAGGDHGALSTN